MTRVSKPGTWLLAAVVAVLALSVSCAGTGGFGAHREHHDAMHGGRDSRGDQVVEATGAVEVVIENNSFRPGNLRLAVGTSVTWTNRDRVAHTATARDGSWDSGILRDGQSGTLTFSEPGIYEYYCVPHPSMRARIEVVK